MSFGAVDVLNEAIRSLEAGPLPERDREHGPWCPFCAAANAKGVLDERHGTGVPVGVIIDDLLAGRGLSVEHDEDAPLVAARKAIQASVSDGTGFWSVQADALTALRLARDSLQTAPQEFEVRQ